MVVRHSHIDGHRENDSWGEVFDVAQPSSTGLWYTHEWKKMVSHSIWNKTTNTIRTAFQISNLNFKELNCVIGKKWGMGVNGKAVAR